MKTGLAIWHYPHRTLEENVRRFSRILDSVSALGSDFVRACRAEDQGEALNEALSEFNPVFTVHHKLPSSHSEPAVSAFQEDIRLAAVWQKRYGRLATLSFDVPEAIRDQIYPYLRMALDAFEGEDTRIAVEDFGLTDAELCQLEPLKGEPRFGFLVDVGHLNIRLHGRRAQDAPTLFRFSGLECPGKRAQEPVMREHFYRALAGKPFPVFEMHLHNNDGVDDVHWFLENGVLDIEMIAGVLREIGYDDVLTLESAPGFRFPCAGQAADDGIDRTIAFWKEILSRAS